MLRFLTCIAFVAATSWAAAERPNFVFVFSDDVNRDCWGVYGNPDCQTPNIDKLAAEGMRFESVYCTVAMCAPFRQELFSGRSPWRTTTLANHSKSTPDTKSLPHYLKPLGYKVGLIGKTHIGPKPAYPFEYFGATQDSNDKFIAHATRFIDDSLAEKKNFCLFLASSDGHAPFTTGDASQYPPDKLTVPPYWLDTPETRERMSAHYAEVTNFDALVGRVRALLEEKGQLENTVYMVCSEQGVQFPFAKWTCFDNGLHTALVARHPKRVKEGSVAPQLISLMDVAPTLVELAGGELKEGDVDGKSFVSVLDGKPNEINDYVLGAFTNCNISDNAKRIYPIRCIRDKRYTLIWCPAHKQITSNVTLTNALGMIDGVSKTASKKHGGGELAMSWAKRREDNKRAAFLVKRLFHRPEYALYDRSTDPYEEKNLAKDPAHQETFERLKKELHVRLAKLGDADPIATEMQLSQGGRGN